MNTVKWQRHVANVAIGAATARGAGAKGTVQAARDYLAAINLGKLVGEADVSCFLDTETKGLQSALPLNAQHWGLARKILNIFLRDCVFNHFLRTRFALHRVESQLEIPIDSYVQSGLKTKATRGELPRWRGVIHLREEENRAYQDFAGRHFSEWNVHNRVHLDIVLWGEGRDAKRQKADRR